MLITPLTALAPHMAAPGPRITSIRSMSLNIVSSASHSTPENKGEYTLRPSLSTNSLLAKRPLKPRMLTAQRLLAMRATSTPGAMRSASGMLRTPERRMSSREITNTAAATSCTSCTLREALLISIFSKSSRGMFSKSSDHAGRAAVDAPRHTSARRSWARQLSGASGGGKWVTRAFFIFFCDALTASFRAARDQKRTMPDSATSWHGVLDDPSTFLLTS